MTSRLRLGFALLAAFAGCAPRSAPPAPAAEGTWSPLDYGEDANWVCHPGRDDDACTSADLTATEILPDGSTRVVEHRRTEEPAYDCFYIHPTFAFAYATGNEAPDTDEDRALDPVLQQAALFTSQCRVFAPRYRQIRLMTYVADPEVERGLEHAYADVEAAFRHYLEHEAGDRPFVLLGHSQGAHTGRRLVERVIAREPALRARLALAVLLGGDVLVDARTGAAANTGGVPLCGAHTTRGCIVAYRAYAADRPPPAGLARTVIGGVPDGLEPACAAPSPDGRKLRFGASYIATRARQNAYDPWPRNRPRVPTPFVLYRDFYAGECVEDARGLPYLAISAAPRRGDRRENRLPFDAIYYRPDILGLHLLEFAFAMGDLRAMAERAASTVRAEDRSRERVVPRDRLESYARISAPGRSRCSPRCGGP